MNDECEHGVEGGCMLCIREGENKSIPDDDDEPYEGPMYPGDEVPGYGDWDENK